MKKATIIGFVVMVAMLVSVTGFAKSNQGTWWITCENAFNYTNTSGGDLDDTDTSITTFGINAAPIYFFMDNLGVLVNLGYESTSVESDFGDSDVDVTTYGIGLIYAYDMGMGHPFGKLEYRAGTLGGDAEGDVSRFRIGGGYIYNVAESFGVGGQLTYDMITESNGDDFDYNKLGLGLVLVGML